MNGDLFSLGGLLASRRQTGNSVLPWLAAAGLLAAAAVWDPLARSGDIDFVLLGLAGYELILGLTRETAPSATSS
jgi:hypothetical protein